MLLHELLQCIDDFLSWLVFLLDPELLEEESLEVLVVGVFVLILYEVLGEVADVVLVLL